MTEAKGEIYVDDCNFEAAVIKNLSDAGCDSQTIERYRALEARSGCRACARREQIRLLQQYRKRLLEELHGCQSRLDCLDYLIYRLKQDEDKERIDET